MVVFAWLTGSYNPLHSAIVAEMSYSMSIFGPTQASFPLLKYSGFIDRERHHVVKSQSKIQNILSGNITNH